MRPRTVSELWAAHGVVHVPPIPKAVTALDREVERVVRQPIGSAIASLTQAADAAGLLALNRDALGDGAGAGRDPDPGGYQRARGPGGGMAVINLSEATRVPPALMREVQYPAPRLERA